MHCSIRHPKRKPNKGSPLDLSSGFVFRASSLSTGTQTMISAAIIAPPHGPRKGSYLRNTAQFISFPDPHWFDVYSTMCMPITVFKTMQAELPSSTKYSNMKCALFLCVLGRVWNSILEACLVWALRIHVCLSVLVVS